MRGEVLHYDEAQGFGFITGADGNRYTFRREDLRRPFPVSKGTAVEFRESGGQARDVFSIRDEPRQAAAAPAPTPIATPAATPAQQHFGRNAATNGGGFVQEPTSTDLWSYFWNGVTTNYANFRTRARRKEYWGFVLFYFLALIVLSLAGVAVDFALGNMEPGYEFPIVTIGISLLVVLAGIIPSIAIMVRRQHDIGLSGWFYLLFLIPYVGYLILLVFALIPSQKHENKWGPVPAGVTIPPPYTG